MCFHTNTKSFGEKRRNLYHFELTWCNLCEPEHVTNVNKESQLKECGKMEVLLLPGMIVNAAIQMYLIWSSINTSINILPVTTALAAISLHPILHTSSSHLLVHLYFFFFFFDKDTSIHAVC